MRIQYFSDIHLEFGRLSQLDADSDVIVAAGDIGVSGQGIEWLKQAGKPVVYVAGNHEYYGQEYHSTLEALRKSSAGSSVRFLERENFVHQGVRFLGCTLWTELGGEENDNLDQLLESINDFRKIRYYNGAMSFADHVLLHRESRRWLINELERPFDGRTVVVTHHAPTYWSWQEGATDIMRFAYCTDLRELFHTYDITAWIHGHTHAVSDYRCAGSRILCNPRGYFPDHLVEDFYPTRMIDV